jgi:formate C-acetyltransferase
MKSGRHGTVLLAFYSDLAVDCDLVCDRALKYHDADVASAFATINCCLERGRHRKMAAREDFVSSSNIGHPWWATAWPQ